MYNLNNNIRDTEKAGHQQEQVLLHHSDAAFKSPLSPISFRIDMAAVSPEVEVHDHHQQQTLIKDSWLPITQSTNGNSFFAAFHILSSNLPFQSLMLPFAFSTLGWYVPTLINSSLHTPFHSTIYTLKY